MLYEFKSRATGTVVMTAPVAERLLAIVGRTPAAKGIFTVDQMGPALAALQAAVDAEAAEAQQAVNAAMASGPSSGATVASAGKTSESDWPAHDSPQQPAPITLRQRAWPLMDMLRTAQAKGKDITWGA